MTARFHIHFCLILLPLAQPVFAAETIGRWCDQMEPAIPMYNRVIHIYKTDDGRYEMETRWGGQRSESNLRKLEDGEFLWVGSPTEETFTVNGDGNLEVTDNAGTKRIAKRLDDTPQDGEC